MNIQRLAAILALASATTAAAENFPMGTFIFTGSVMNWKNELCTSADKLTVQAVASDGTILASSKVIDPNPRTGANYRLEIPVSSEASGKSAAIGDELSCVVLSAAGSTNVSPRPLPPVDRANAVARVNLEGASATSFDIGDGRSVLVSDEYLAGIQPWMASIGKDSYEPDADWDGDGVPNYAEYIAGTNPFDASDLLQIMEHEFGEEATLLTFEYAGGHLYAVASSPSLTEPEWMDTPFRRDAEASEEQTEIWFPGSESGDVGTVTLHLAPASGTPVLFYGITAK